MVLAGGAGRRFGGVAKGLEIVDGRRIIDRVADALREVTTEVVLAANDPSAREWLPGVPVVPDVRAGRGGLAGVDAALQRGLTGVLVVAWDMPFVTPDLLRALLGAAHTSRADLVIPESDSPYGFEPFCAYYRKELALALAAFLDGGGGAARDFVRQVERVHRIAIADVERIGDPRRLFFSVNTPDDLERAREMAASG